MHSAQVLTPAEIKDPDLRSLQQQYINDLKVVGQDIQALPLKYHFYLNRKLDLDESATSSMPISVRFDLIATTARPYWQSPATTTLPTPKRLRRTSGPAARF